MLLYDLGTSMTRSVIIYNLLLNFFLRNDAYGTSQYGDHVLVDIGNKTEGDTDHSRPPADSFVLSDNLVRISLPNGTVSNSCNYSLSLKINEIKTSRN